MFWSGEVHTSRLNHLRYDNSTWLNFKKQLQDGTLVEQVWHRHHNHPRAPPLSLLIKNQSLSMKMQVVWNTLNPSKTTLQRPFFLPPTSQKYTEMKSQAQGSALESHDGLCLTLLTCVCICSAQAPCASVYVLKCVCVCISPLPRPASAFSPHHFVSSCLSRCPLK